MNELYVIIIGFIGGILGGILVNVISYKFVKWNEKQEEPDLVKKSVLSLLNQISTSWETESSKRTVDRSKIQNLFDIYSSQLSSAIARAPPSFPQDIINDVKDLCISLTKLQDFTLTLGMERYQAFLKEAQGIVEQAEKLKKKLS